MDVLAGSELGCVRMSASMNKLSSAATLAIAVFALQATMAQTAGEVLPAPYQVAWQDLEFGVIIHFSTNTFLNQEWGDGTANPRIFNPAQFDPAQWMRAIRDSGAKYVVLVAKHHDGFCLWPTSQTTYGVRSSPWKDGKGDVVGDVARAARKYGLRFGVYLSPWDRHEPKYRDSTAYDAYYNAELEELASNYGDLVEFWLDGAGSEGHVYNFAKIIETLRTYQPNTVVFADTGLFEYGDARWVGNEAGIVNYENWNVIDRHGYRRWRPVEADTPLRKEHWFWHPNDEASVKSVDELLDTYDKTVGHGAQLMLGLAPDNRGLLPDSDVKRLEELGQALKRRSEGNLALKHVKVDADVDAALDGDVDTFWSAPQGSNHATLELAFASPQTFDHAVTMEWLDAGQNVQKYAIEAWDADAGNWKAIASGQAIGHEKIDSFAAVTATRVRLNILSSVGSARIREFQLYRGNETAAK
jgi:alpha-L-fucosidase